MNVLGLILGVLGDICSGFCMRYWHYCAQLAAAIDDDRLPAREWVFRIPDVRDGVLHPDGVLEALARARARRARA